MNVDVGATWVAGTKTYTLQRIWLHYENGIWETWVAIEVKWKKRARYSHARWATVEAELRQEGAVIQDSPAVQRFEIA